MRWQVNIKIGVNLNPWVKDKGSLSNKIINIMPFRIKELKGICRDNGISGFSNLKKDELISILSSKNLMPVSP